MILVFGFKMFFFNTQCPRTPFWRCLTKVIMYVFSYRLLKGFTVSVKITILEIGGFQISLRCLTWHCPGKHHLRGSLHLTSESTSLYKTCVKTSLYVIAFWWKGINFFMNYPRTHILEVKKKTHMKQAIQNHIKH